MITVGTLHRQILRKQLTHPRSPLLWVVVLFAAVWSPLVVGADFSGGGVDTATVTAHFFLFSFLITLSFEGDPARWKAFGLTRRQAAVQNLTLAVPVMAITAALSFYNLRGTQWVWGAAAAAGVVVCLQVRVQWRLRRGERRSPAWSWERPAPAGPFSWRAVTGPGLAFSLLVAAIAGAAVFALYSLADGRFAYFVPLVAAFSVTMPPLIVAQSPGSSLAAWQAFNAPRRSWMLGIALLAAWSAALSAVVLGAVLWGVGEDPVPLLRGLLMFVAAGLMLGLMTGLNAVVANGAFGALAGGGGVLLTNQPGWGVSAVFAGIFCAVSGFVIVRLARARSVATKPDLKPERGV